MLLIKVYTYFKVDDRRSSSDLATEGAPVGVKTYKIELYKKIG